jgi:uncharacterized protein
MKIIGRNVEIEILSDSLRSIESKLIAVYGRRRVGKTFLIRQFYKKNIILDIAGLHTGTMHDQLSHFKNKLIKIGYKEAKQETVKNWMQAFGLLEDYVDTIKTKEKKVIFIDELPWFDTPRSKFLMAFQNFWNDYCSKRNDLIVVICGSAAAWMIKKVMKNKGGLHNRVTEKIRLMPFTLKETELFLQNKGIRWSQYDITQLYMTVGGIPFYLNGIRKGESYTQYIDRACFTDTGLLYEEFDELYSSLFDKSELHYNVIKALGAVKAGISRSAVIEKANLSSGGTFTKVIDELTESGFVTKFLPFDNNTNLALFRLTDYFTMFYLKFMKNAKASGNGTWAAKAVSSSWHSWAGLAFESICLQHIAQIKKALKLTAIYTEVSSWKGEYEGNAAQIDLLIDRADNVINLCEIKFSKSEFIITKSYASELQNKMSIFSMQPNVKNKNLFLTLITVRGTSNNSYVKEMVQNQVVLKDLFVIP